MSEKAESNFASASMKIPIFNGSDRSKYQDWEDDMLAVLEYHDVEEYIDEEWKDKKMPLKIETDELKTLQRKEMKKAKAILVRGTSELPSMLVKEAETPYEAFAALREKYKVKKVREDFDKLDSDWNDFKVDDASVDPDLIFKTLEEQSKKLGIFGERYSKDALQMLSKLKSCMTSDYDHVFTFLNTNEERSKSFEEQLVTAKTMISSHYKTKIIGNEKMENTMICMLTGSMTAPPNPYSQTTCEFCKKKGHPKMKNGKPFCFKYKKKLKQDRKYNNSNNDTNKNKNNNKPDDDKDINSLFVNCVITDQCEGEEDLWLGDTGAQCHVRIAKTEDENTNSNLYKVTMGNNSSASVLGVENLTIKDQLGSTIHLHNTRVVK